MSRYTLVIGLEVHCELKTETKMFCGCKNDPNERHPNINVCPVCLGHPGTLPTINKAAVEHIVKIGIALGGDINAQTKFDRKNYFYPDLPKGYQISQYDKPIVEGGKLHKVRITRVHLEEDAGRLVHGVHNSETLVDYNRASVPLMELVTEPDIRSAEEAGAFAKELQQILRYLGVSDADMEKGQMRLEANISLGTFEEEKLKFGTKVEVKNINSFKALQSAILFEEKRQEEALQKGERIVQETRGWDDVKLRTVSQRSKENAHDYRYFPEPDLPPFEPQKVFDVEKMRNLIPELPEEKRVRFRNEYEMSDAQLDFLIADISFSNYFEAAVSELEEEAKPLSADAKKERVRLLLNYLMSDLAGLTNQAGIFFSEIKVTPEHLAHLVILIGDQKISSRQAKDILKKCFDTGLDPNDILEQEGLHTIKDEEELQNVIRKVMEENPAAVADFKKGKEASLQFLIGKAMGKLKGRGNPQTLKDIFTRELSV